MTFLPRLLPLVIFFTVVAAQTTDQKLDPAKVDLMRMLVDPYSYWSQPYSFFYFRNMDAIPGLRIDWLRKPERAFPLQQAKVPLDPTYVVKDRTFSLDEYLTRADVTAFLVLKDDQIVFEKYLHGASRDDQFISFSIGKSVTSVLFGIAVDEGRIKSVDDAVTAYLPELKGTSYDKVTLRNVLQMATGVRYDEMYLQPESDVHRLLDVLMRGDQSFAALAKTYGAREPERQPGTQFDYQSIDTQVLAEVLERVTGMRMSRYAQEKLWSKLGPEADAFFFQSEKLQTTCGFACFNATARDYARFALMAMNRGELGGTRIVSERWMRDSTTAPSYDNGYGYQWWLNANSPDGAFRAVGIYGQTLYINPAKRVVIVQLSARPRPSGGGGQGAPPNPFEAIAARLGN